MRRWLAGFLGATLGVGCGLAFSPGDYGGTTSAAPDAAPPDAALTDAPSGDATPTAPLAHVLIISGNQADGGVLAEDIWTATIDANGDLGSFVYNAPNPLAGPVQAGAIVGSTLLLSSFVNGGRIVQTAPFDGGIVPVGFGENPIVTPDPPGFGQFFAASTLVSLGGVSQVDDGSGDGTTISDFDAGVYVAIPDGSAYASANVALSPTLLPVGVANVTAATSGSFVYLNGIGDAQDQAAQIYVGTLDPTAGVTNLRATQPMTNAGSPHLPQSPMLCAGDGFLFVAGGNNGTNSIGVVVYAAIDAASGLVQGAWKTGPNLPDVLQQAGCFVHDQALYLVGGLSGMANGDAGTTTNRILRSRIQPDGTMAGWELSAGQPLPAPRSNILALTY